MTTVGVVGAGTMGAGIAQVALEAGDEVILHDVDEAAVERATARIRAGLTRGAAGRGPIPLDLDAWAEQRVADLRRATTLDQIAAEAELVVEAALEDLELKQTIFRTLDANAPSDTILATNTSALSVARIATSTMRPERVLGLHFFNPVPRMALVEVVVTGHTTPAVADRAEALMAGWGKTTVRSADTPGFIVNRVNRPFTIEALRMVEAGEAGIEAIDAAMRDAGYPMGPFELMDLVGIDVNLAAATAVWDGLGRPAHLRPSPLQERLVEAGRLGRKTGGGFYRYLDGRRGPVAGDVGNDPGSLALDAATIQERIEAAVRSEARRAAADGIARDDDIALALRLGAGHPRSPFG